MRWTICCVLWVLAVSGLSAEWTLRGGVLLNSPGDFSGDNETVADALVENGIGYDIALGYDFPLVRLEGELLYLHSGLDGIRGDYVSAGGDLDRKAAFVNVYVDFAIFPPVFDGYIGAGLGVSRVSLDLQARSSQSDEADAQFSFSDDALIFGGQVMVGLRIELRDRVHANVGYRYLLFQDTAVGNRDLKLSASSGEHTIEASIGIGF